MEDIFLRKITQNEIFAFFENYFSVNRYNSSGMFLLEQVYLVLLLGVPTEEDYILVNNKPYVTLQLEESINGEIQLGSEQNYKNCFKLRLCTDESYCSLLLNLLKKN